MDEKNIQLEHGVDRYIYTYHTGENGNMIAVNNQTGELHETSEVVVPVGTRFILPEEQEANRERKKRQEESQKRRDTSRELGDFYFVKVEQEFPGLSPQTLARLVFLETYVGYADKSDKNRNRLMLTQKTQMKREDLKKILKLSKSKVCDFWKEVSPAYITEDSDGYLYSNTDVFMRGTLKRREYTAYQRFYRDGIRAIYNSVESTQHRYLGYVYQMLRFTNFEYNVLCKNPDERDKEKIQPITVREFCAEIGFDFSNWHRLEKVYRTLRFVVDGVSLKFCAFVTDGGNKADMRIIINPRVIYGGTDYRKVDALDIIFR